MRIVKSGLRDALVGLMIGALMSMLVMIAIGHPVTVAPEELAGMLAMSSLIGLLSGLFKIEALPFWGALALHFVLVGAIVFATSSLLGGLFGAPLGLLGLYSVIYMVVWLLLRVWCVLDARRINARIKQRNRD